MYKQLNMEAAGSIARRIAMAGLGLALVASVRVAARAATPEGSPLRVELPAPAEACTDDGWGSSDSDANGFRIQRRLRDGLRLCARVRGPVAFDSSTGAIRELPAGSSVLVETRSARGDSQRMLVSSEPGGPRHQWWVNGASLPVDDGARGWLQDALVVIAAEREIGGIQGEVGRLQGEIGRIQGEIGTLQGRIGEIQGEIGALQGRIGAIQGERGRLQGEIGSHQGAIGGLEASRFDAAAARAREIDQEIARHRAAIRELEAKLESSAYRKRLDDAEAELRAFERNSSGRIDELERKIEAIRRADRIGQLEKQIEDLHADDRIDEIKRRVAPVVERLARRVHTPGS
jgi:predicted  nucleic acid-binding Zn-ribbon protein